MVLSILDVHQATRCSKSLVKRDSLTGLANGTDLSYYSVDWTLQSSKLTIKPCLADSHVHMSPSGVDSSSVVAKVRTVVAIRTYKLGTSELELYNYLPF